MITIIAAINKNRGLGFENKLLYWLPNDLKRFKALTTGHTIIMGRKTFESLPKGHSLEEALAHCAEEEDVYIIGGASLYAEALSIADRLCLTEIEDADKEADVFFPEVDQKVWKEVNRETHPIDEKHAYAYSFVDYER